MSMRYDVSYTWRGEKYHAGSYADKTDAQLRAQELLADKWNGVHITPQYPLPESQR
jgi:hypothetical protein